jgi:uncharacterized cupin superfamily protein
VGNVKIPVLDADVEKSGWYVGTNRELFGRALCDVGGVSKIGFGLLELSPGCNTLPAHYHTLEEEHLYVLEGTGTLHLGAETYPLVKGSYVAFPAGQPAPHYISNESERPLKYIMVGERIEGDEVVYADDTGER